MAMSCIMFRVIIIWRSFPSLNFKDLKISDLLVVFFLLIIITYTSRNYTKLKKNKDIYKTINTQKLNLAARRSR